MNRAYNRRSVLAPIFFLVLAAALLVGLWLYFSPRGTTGEKHITITVTYQDGTSESYDADTDAEYLKEAAESVLSLEGEDTQYGYSVYTINGVSADFQNKNVYWAIYVNGEYGNYSIDRQPIADGDAYAFIYESY